MKILVTGATGNLGAKIVEELLKKISPKQLAVSVRDPKKAENLKALGVEVRHGDFDFPETLDAAFAGIDRLLIVSTAGETEPRIKQLRNAVSAAQRANVKFIGYTSIVNASHNKLFVAPAHKDAEEAILKTGIPYSFLRNNWYLENEVGSIQGVMAGAPWVTSAGTGKTGWALQQDFAEAAAVVMTEDGHENTIYELSGTLLTQEELVASLETILEKEITIQQVDDATYTETIKNAGVPKAYIPMLVRIQQDIRNGCLAVESNDFEKILGRSATPIKEALKQIINHSI